MSTSVAQDKVFWKTGSFFWTVLAVGGLLLVWATYSSLLNMVSRWESSEEYGYGFMIPVITLFLIWQRKDKLELLPFTGSWLGVALLALGVLITLVGQLGALNSITQYGFVIALIGTAYALLGGAAFRIILVPLLLLFLMVPLPAFLLNNFSAQLQLISSEIGVAVIRLFGVSVNLDGNVIDLGTYKLQVVEACSGLRYLFPLLALSIIASYFYQAAVWKRLVVILSSAPITVLMNSFRIGVIGVLVEYYGREQAEGFLHDFEGWIVFMVCVALLVGEIWLLSLFGKDRRPFREIFGMEFPVPTPPDVQTVMRVPPKHYLAVAVLLVFAAVSSLFFTARAEIRPPRTELDTFPMQLGEWRGQRDNLEKIYLDALMLDDYVLANYLDNNQEFVNFYVAYYATQRPGEAAHSPRSCIPGGGWQIQQMSQHTVEGVMFNNVPLRVNRLVIQKGDNRQLVYYWFQQRGRVITNEYAVKWYLIVDALRRNRTDGSLVRLTTAIRPDENLSEGDRRLTAFAALAVPKLRGYIPD